MSQSFVPTGIFLSGNEMSTSSVGLSKLFDITYVDKKTIFTENYWNQSIQFELYKKFYSSGFTIRNSNLFVPIALQQSEQCGGELVNEVFPYLPESDLLSIF